jgi:hypothetical protein
MHPILVAALAEDRHRRCPCGVVTQRPYRLCRGCRRQYLEMQDHATAPPRRSPLVARLFRNAQPFARVLSLFQRSKEHQG